VTELRADCARCFGLCCVAPGFTASADFAITKPAGKACPNLAGDFRCTIHERLRPSGFTGCTVYDCFGAGQRVAQETFGGTDWRQAPDTADAMFAAFGVMRQLHELLWYLTQASTLDAAAGMAVELRGALGRTEAMASLDAAALASLDVEPHRRDVATLLRRASALARSTNGARGADLAGADLVGRRLQGADLRRADLRGACLIGADLRGAKLRLADVIGADLRAANVGGADLAGTLFLTQFQVNAATGSSSTTLPPSLTRPAHWAAA
jgi:uncharacterized protein YjbI with pentapeptide repeats